MLSKLLFSLSIVFVLLLLAATYAEVHTLTPGDAVQGSVSQGSWKHYKLSVKNDDKKVKLTVTQTNGDCDVYLRLNAKASRRHFYKKITDGTSEMVFNLGSSWAGTDIFAGVFGKKNKCQFQIKAKLSNCQDDCVDILHLDLDERWGGSVFDDHFKYYKIIGDNSHRGQNLYITVNVEHSNQQCGVYAAFNYLPTEDRYRVTATSRDSAYLDLGNNWQDKAVFVGVLGYNGYDDSCYYEIEFVASKCGFNCYGHGTCQDDGTCKCDTGFSGELCTEEKLVSGSVYSGHLGHREYDTYNTTFSSSVHDFKMTGSDNEVFFCVSKKLPVNYYGDFDYCSSIESQTLKIDELDEGLWYFFVLSDEDETDYTVEFQWN